MTRHIAYLTAVLLLVTQCFTSFVSANSPNPASANSEYTGFLGITDDELSEVTPFKTTNPSLLQKMLGYIKGTRHKKKPRGKADPHYPVDISFKQKMLPLPSPNPLHGIDSAIEGNFLNMEALTLSVLENLDTNNLEQLTRYLVTKSMKIKIIHQKMRHSHKRHSWIKLNAAATLALTMGIQDHKELLTQILSLAPMPVFIELAEAAPSLFSAPVVACTLMNMMKNLNDTNTSMISRSSALLVDQYIKYWAGKDAEELNKHLRNLILQIHEYKGNLHHFSPKELGVLLGSLLAGSLAHCTEIKSSDIKRQWMVNSTINLIWAATTFLGVVPWFGGNIASAIGGTVNVAVVGTAVAYNYFRVPRNYASIVREIEGEIKISALDSAKTPESRLNVSSMLEWIDAVIELNGQPA